MRRSDRRAVGHGEVPPRRRHAPPGSCPPGWRLAPWRRAHSPRRLHRLTRETGPAPRPGAHGLPRGRRGSPPGSRPPGASWRGGPPVERRDRAGGTDRAGREQLPALPEVPVNGPEPPERQRQTQGRLGVPPQLGPAQGRAQVVVLALEPGEPDRLRRAGQLRLGGLRQIEVVEDVPPMDTIGLTALSQVLQRILADRLQHDVPGLAVSGRLLAEEAGGDQRLSSVERIEVQRRHRDRVEPCWLLAAQQTLWMASRVQPRKTASRRNSVCWAGSSRS